jgi:hypothetical protein
MGYDTQDVKVYECGCKHIFSYTEGAMGIHNIKTKDEYCDIHKEKLYSLENEIKRIKKEITSQKYTTY